MFIITILSIYSLLSLSLRSSTLQLAKKTQFINQIYKFVPSSHWALHYKYHDFLFLRNSICSYPESIRVIRDKLNIHIMLLINPKNRSSINYKPWIISHDCDMSDVYNNYVKILMHKMIAQLYVMIYKKLWHRKINVNWNYWFILIEITLILSLLKKTLRCAEMR